MCPDCSPPSRLPAPRISRSFIATCMPAPSSVFWRDGGQPVVAPSRSAASPAGRGSRRTPAPGRGRPGRAAGAAGTGRRCRPARRSRVLAFGMSRPDSTIVVHTSTSKLLLPEADHHLLQGVLVHLPVPDARSRASGTSSRSRAAARSIESTRLCTKKTWPSRSSSRRMAAAICFSSYGADEGEDRVPLLRRGQDRGHLPDAGQRHLQRARDRRRRHRQHVDRGAQRA